MPPQRRGRGVGRGVNVRTRGVNGARSPLSQGQVSSTSFTSLGSNSLPTTQNNENSGTSTTPPDLRKRKWTSSVWCHFNCFDGSNYEDGIPRAVCKYCHEGPILAPSNLGTSNFKRHIETCDARPTGVSGEVVPGRDGLLVKKIDKFHYREKVALAIIRHGYPFTYAEHEGNRDVHEYLNDTVKFMSRNTEKKVCMKIHEREKGTLKKNMASISGKMCLTCDMWTSCVDQGYLSITAHYVDDDWNLHAKILNFFHLEPPHDALNMHGKLLEFIKEWDITKKVFTITLDNAICNDNMQNLLSASLQVYSPLYCSGKFFHVRCGAHILNLIVQAGLKLCDSGVTKIRKLVTYVGCSERRLLEFEVNVNTSKLDKSKGLYMDCPTRWNSTYKMLGRTIYFRYAFRTMSMSSRYDVTFPPLPTDEEWARVHKICALLKPFDEITTLISGRKYPTSNLYLKCVWRIEFLLLKYEKCKDWFVSKMAKEMKVKFDKYWKNYSLILSFAAILDPRYKFEFVRYCFTELDPTTAEAKSNYVKVEFYQLFEEYAQLHPTFNLNSQPQRVEDELPGFASFAADVQRVYSTQLDFYLEETRSDHNLELDVLQWWKENEKRFPIVAIMAKDILAIPVTTVASESAFSMRSRLITKWRSSLKPDTADALMTTRTWLYGFEVKEAKNENQLLDGFEYVFPALRINDNNEDLRDDVEDENEEFVPFDDETHISS